VIVVITGRKIGSCLRAGLFLLGALVSGPVWASGDVHSDEGAAYGHCLSVGESVKSQRNAITAGFVASVECIFSTGPLEGPSTGNDGYRCEVVKSAGGSALCDSFGFSGIVEWHNFPEAATCFNRPDITGLVGPMIVNSNGLLDTNFTNPFCNEGCVTNLSVGGSEGCVYFDANENLTADEGELGECDAFAYTEAAGFGGGVCSSGAGLPSSSGDPGTSCTGSDCSSGGGGGGSGGGGSTGGGGTVPTTGSGTGPAPSDGGAGDITPTPIEGDTDADGNCENGEPCQDNSLRNDLLAEINDKLGGEGIDTGQVGDPIGKGQDADNILGEAVGDAVAGFGDGGEGRGTGGDESGEKGSEITDSFESVFGGGGSCPEVSITLSKGWTYTMSTDFEAAVRGVNTLVVWVLTLIGIWMAFIKVWD
jgi:hypothetical protein